MSLWERYEPERERYLSQQIRTRHYSLASFGIGAGVLLTIAVNVVLWVAVAWVAIHFARKYW